MAQLPKNKNSKNRNRKNHKQLQSLVTADGKEVASIGKWGSLIHSPNLGENRKGK